MNNLIDQHKRMAMGESIDAGGTCEPAFRGGLSHDDGSSRKKHMTDEKRGMSPKEKHADHGPHDMHPLDKHD